MKNLRFISRHWARLGLSMALCAALLTPAMAQSTGPITIKFSHVVSPEAPKGKAALFFARRAAELSGNKVRVMVYANSMLYNDKDEMQAVLSGDVEMLAPSLAKFSALGVQQFEVFDVPYLFSSLTDVHRITDGPVGASLMGKLEARGIKGLAFWDNGFKSFSANTPIKTPADLKGKRLRIQNSKVLEEEVNTLEATPVPMPFSAVYGALKTGGVDGTENPISNFYTQKMREVQKHLTLTNHGYLGYAVIANKAFWDRLPSDVRKALEQAMKEATVYANKVAREDNEGMMAAERVSGRTTIYDPKPEELQAFRKALWASHAKAAPRVGQDLLAQIYKELAITTP
ncbi:DctP family TRAP transporter solute-binding subunit [Curvibacter sp. CHRR-16]|uniref:DctP family TRAP transporter solute-binding subunit n=1 Tax=Curvibacter sp. CHRR-16 TaxID=2835872 RepID=UPI001BD981BF|nr:DctP family TRAP transporter solute-binding subunit [Curvibacter sp. CHRR-16]MBT0570249.1 DctP family TRAP transporter solute-binding subunit [Curvibacter sp. CHRR-16]